MRYLLIISLLVLISCSPQKRMKRLIKNHPELLTKDIMVVRDTFIINSIKADTTFISKSERDTFILEKDRLKLKIIKHFDTLRVEAECEGDTVYRTINVPYEKVVVQLSFWDKYGNWLIIILVCTALYFGIKKFAV